MAEPVQNSPRDLHSAPHHNLRSVNHLRRRTDSYTPHKSEPDKSPACRILLLFQMPDKAPDLLPTLHSDAD